MGRSPLLVRLQRQLAVSPDPDLAALYEEVQTYRAARTTLPS